MEVEERKPLKVIEHDQPHVQVEKETSRQVDRDGRSRGHVDDEREEVRTSVLRHELAVEGQGAEGGSGGPRDLPESHEEGEGNRDREDDRPPSVPEGYDWEHAWTRQSRREVEGHLGRDQGRSGHC